MTYTVSPVVAGFIFIDSTDHRLKIFGEKNPRRSQKAKFEFSTHQALYADTWIKCCVGVPCCSICKYRLYANTMPFYMRALSISEFWYRGWECPGTNPQWIWGTTVFIIAYSGICLPIASFTWIQHSVQHVAISNFAFLKFSGSFFKYFNLWFETCRCRRLAACVCETFLNLRVNPLCFGGGRQSWERTIFPSAGKLGIFPHTCMHYLFIPSTNNYLVPTICQAFN